MPDEAQITKADKSITNPRWKEKIRDMATSCAIAGSAIGIHDGPTGVVLGAGIGAVLGR